MSRMSKRKGSAGEREVVNLCHAHGFTAVRTRSGGGQERGDLVGVPGLSLEIKRQERLNLPMWLRQAEDNSGGDTAAVAHRRNGERWYVTLELSEFLAAWKAAQS